MLGYVGDPRTAADVAAYLEHPGRPQSPDRDVSYASYRMMAALALQSIVSSPPVTRARGTVTDADIMLWRTWWADHRDEYPIR